MISVNFNEAQTKRILDKLKKIAENAAGPYSKLYFRVEIILQSYKDAVLSAMGTVNAGTYRDPLTGIGSMNFDGENVSFYWEPLSPRTIGYKQGRKLTNGAEVTFWYATGSAKKGVKVYQKLSKYHQKAFAGIDGTKDREAFEHAIRAEYGGPSETGKYIPPRALFTLLNEVFKKHRQRIIDGLRKDLMDGVNWGSR